MWDLIVVGGGAAGLWAAGTAAQRGRHVMVIEKNRKAGVKILMSGGTRCNITHDCGIQGIIQAFDRQGRFLKPALHQLPPTAVVAEINRQGVETKVEETGKVFPVSNRAIDVRDALVRRLSSAGATLQPGVAVTDVRALPDGGWRVCTGTDEVSSRSVLLCSGGLSYSGCGTTGDGYAWAARVGHTIAPTFPALTPLLSPATWVHELSGITLPDVKIRVVADEMVKKDKRAVDRGGFLWTHFGCSGPAPMNVSRSLSMLTNCSEAQLLIDLVPDIAEEQLERMLSAAEGGSRSVAAVLQSWIPRNLAHRFMARAEVLEATKLAELPRAARRSLVNQLKRLSVPLSGTRGYAKAEVTAGGVSTAEVNPHTLESRLAAGLFFAGEILDIDGPIGGFNFQAAFSTGHTAGLNV